MKCFYHSADLDGHCSGALIKLRYPECEMIGINYGEDFLWNTISEDETVFMVDFSLQPFEKMITLNKRCGRLIWIDHHISALKEHESYKGAVKIEGLRRNGIGACQLVWEYLRDEPVPEFVKLLAEYDVWNHSNPKTLPFQMGMRLHDTSPENTDFWQELFDSERVMRIVEDGGIILKYQKLQNEKYSKSCAFETELDGLKVIAANAMLVNSKLFDAVWDEEKHDAMLVFGWRNGKWTCSLYTPKTDKIDVSKIAKARGGGGHAGAAGFQCEELPFELK
jgi:oligoribonuclease NrnB/cAMP/cGMP phosphodiesterase (DHH superfamily)